MADENIKNIYNIFREILGLSLYFMTSCEYKVLQVFSAQNDIQHSGNDIYLFSTPCIPIFYAIKVKVDYETRSRDTAIIKDDHVRITDKNIFRTIASNI
ncbi:MAG: hypothetical protein OEY79_01920 [Anaplasmataceae bacterium]|nr:hypothetical protein [Anaplasmataceae bacterium]